MAPLMCFNFRKVLLLYLVLFLFTSVLMCASSSNNGHHLESKQFLGRRRMLLEVEKDQDQQPKKKITNLSSKNQTKLTKPSLSTKNQTKLIKTNQSLKNQTKLTKPANSTKPGIGSTLSKTGLKKLNSSSQLKKLNSTSKASNFTKSNTSTSIKKTSDLLKLGSPKNKTTKPSSTKQTQSLVGKKVSDLESQKQNKDQKKPKTTSDKQKQPILLDQEDEDDSLVSEFRDLPTKFQETFKGISVTSKKYLTKANKEMTKNFKPILGNKYAPTIASIVSFTFILIPLLLVSLLFNRIKTYFSLQKILIFVQVYLSIYFAILCLSALVTGLEPLKFFYASSQSTYICVMVLQTLAYVLYLLLLLMYLILVFATDCGLGSRLLGLGQTFVGFAVGLHYYVAVFHRVALRQPPKTNWKVHGIYATCFLVICLCAGAERRKKAYLQEGGEEGKKN